MTIGSHQRCIGKSQTHLTPQWIVQSLGEFDLDPCAAKPRPWDCATTNWHEDGHIKKWFGRVWLNPPFNRFEVGAWVEQMARHGNGILLIHARTETKWFRPIWRSADAILFLSQRISFCDQSGKAAEANSGAPVVLAAFGAQNAAALVGSGIAGAYVENHRLI